MNRQLSCLLIFLLVTACITVKREDLGHGFKVVTHREKSDVGFERYGYFRYLRFGFKDLGSVGFVEVSPSGQFALYEGDGTLMLFSVRTGLARDVTEGSFFIPRDVRWQEDEGVALVLYYDNRKPTEVSLRGQGDVKRQKSAAQSNNRLKLTARGRPGVD